MTKLEKVNVFGRVYPIVYEDLSSENIWGDHLHDERMIRIDENLTPENERATILHEVIHAILFESGLHSMLTRKLEETLCRSIENGLIGTGLIKDTFDEKG
jgi:Zn-dependent peptidase ImmA (M78 family)